MDGQTDGQTACNLITALCVGSRGKNTDLGISIDKVIATVGLKQLSTLAIATIVAESATIVVSVDRALKGLVYLA